MEERSRQRRLDSVASESNSELNSEPDGPLVQAHTTTPEKVVFTEQGNTDGWIATDTVVDIWR